MVVANWAYLSVNLPSEEDMAFIRNSLPDSLQTLQEGLFSKSKNVRMATAFAAEELGTATRPLVSTMVERIQSEPDAIIRLYLASAIAEIGSAEPDDINKLGNVFQFEADVQAKTHMAGALVRLTSPAEQTVAWEWILNSLKAFPPTPPKERKAQSSFWEQRWGAIKHARRIKEKEAEFLPLLTALNENPETPRRVIDQQIAPALRELRK